MKHNMKRCFSETLYDNIADLALVEPDETNIIISIIIIINIDIMMIVIINVDQEKDMRLDETKIIIMIMMRPTSSS